MDCLDKKVKGLT